jgi:hypothetical protein
MEPWIGLIGVVIGFGLSIGYEGWKNYSRKKMLLQALRSEIESIIKQIPSFIDLCIQAKESLQQRQVLPLESVRATTVIYDSYFAEIVPELEIEERNVIIVAYERVRVADAFRWDFKDRFFRDLNEKSLNNPIEVYKKLLQDMIVGYLETTELLLSYLQGRPIDVFPSMNELNKTRPKISLK